MKTFVSTSFEDSLQMANKILLIVGLQTDDEDSNQTFYERHWNRKFFWFFNLTLYSQLLGEIAWFYQQGVIESNFAEVTYTIPCATLCLLGSAKTLYRIKYSHHINDLIHSLRKLQSAQFDTGVHSNPTEFKVIRIMVEKVQRSIKVLFAINCSALVAFLFGPLIIMGYVYYETGVMELKYPFLIMYPFDIFDIRVYPFVYFHQMVGGVFAVFTVLGPDCLYYVFCTFVHIQFFSLRYDLERIVPMSNGLQLQEANDAYRERFKACVGRHGELIRCCNLIEAIYCKSALFNFMTSSLLLCLAGFNIMAFGVGDLAMFSNFVSFLLMCVMQIYLICDYGDKISRASMELSSAVYNSQWYTVDAKTAKDLLMIITRAQKPCKLTAYTFAEINLGAFTRILSTSWSYFALLNSVYSRKQ